MKSTIEKIAAWLVSLTRDPGDGSVSSARVAAMICVVVGCGIAIAGMILNREQHDTVYGLLGGGAANLFARNKAAKDGES